MRNELLDLKRNYVDGEWCLGGNFNWIICEKERKGRDVASRKIRMKEFAEFIEDFDLIDVQCKGKKFYRFNEDGRSMSKIDRFLLSEKVIKIWGVVDQIIGNRDVSDHCPIWVIVDNSDWGPKPFRVNNSFEIKEFIPFVEKFWKNLHIYGRSDYVLKEKFRLFNFVLRKWNKEVFGRMDLEIGGCVSYLNLVDDLLLDRREKMVPGLVEERSNAIKQVWLNMKIQENMNFQKSRLKWDRLGDSNNSFFHKVKKDKRHKNFIGSIETEGGLKELVGNVKKEV